MPEVRGARERPNRHTSNPIYLLTFQQREGLQETLALPGWKCWASTSSRLRPGGQHRLHFGDLLGLSSDYGVSQLLQRGVPAVSDLFIRHDNCAGVVRGHHAKERPV